MWRPADVVPEHKKRAVVVWGLLLLGIVGYTAWQIADLRLKLDNPGTSLSISDDVYPFPPLEVCFWGGEGCDERLNESTCIESVIYSVYDTCGEEVKDMRIPNQYYNCMSLNLSKIDLKGFEDGCNEAADKPFVTVEMDWYSSFDPSNEGDYRDAVGVFLGNEPYTAQLTVPYSRVVESRDNDSGGPTFVETDMTISKLTRKFLSGDYSTRYPVLTLSTIEYVHQTETDMTNDTEDDSAYQDSTSYTDDDSSYHNTTSAAHGNSSFAVGYLYVILTQGSFSVTEITDINPLDVGNFVGNIGGFWEVLLVIWGICFVGTKAEAAAYKARNFKQPVQVGKYITGMKRRSGTQTATTGGEGTDDELPARRTAKRSRQIAPRVSTRVIPPVASGTRPNAGASFFRSLIKRDYPKRSNSVSDRSAQSRA